MRIRSLLVVAAMAAGTAACGGDAGPLDAAEDAMAELDRGRMDFALSASGTDDDDAPVGFRVQGPFSIAEDGDLPVFELTYTRLLGGDDEAVELVSTGEAVFVTAGGESQRLDGADVQGLRLGDGGDGFADLGIAGWFREEEVTERDDGTTVVRGDVAAADLLSDLARIASQAEGQGDPGALDGDAGERLERLVRSSDITAELGRDHLPRSIEAVVDFGGRVPESLRDALGPYAAARLRVTLELARLDAPLTVDEP